MLAKAIRRAACLCSLRNHPAGSEEELHRPAAVLAWSALAERLLLGYSFVAEALLMAHLPDTPWRPLISRAGYSVGFLIVILGRQQLFYGKCAHSDFAVAIAQRPENVTKGSAAMGNCFVRKSHRDLLVCPVRREPPCSERTRKRVSRRLGMLTSAPVFFFTVIVRALFAGWLIALMVWLLPGVESAKVSIIIILTYFVGLGGFNHIAGSTTTSRQYLVDGLKGHMFSQLFFIACVADTTDGHHRMRSTICSSK